MKKFMAIYMASTDFEKMMRNSTPEQEWRRG
jgi:hypothetical protein